MRKLISLKTKKKLWPRQETRREIGPCWSFKECDVPWILKKDDISLAKEVIMSVKVPYLYGSSLQRFFIVEDDCQG